MSSSSPYTLRWGILATGGIAKSFAKDLLTDPACRQVSDVRHKIVAVASSRAKTSADKFIEDIDGPLSAKTYGSYAELVADPDVDIIYVATPHSHHFQNVMLCFESGKNVLCEKALTVTAAQAKKLVETAKAKNLFFMEAVWTRFFPISIRIRDLISAGAIGTVYRVFADMSLDLEGDDEKSKLHDSHRMVNKDLAGGALLDVGVYALTWVFQTTYHLHQPKEAPVVSAAMTQYQTGTDETTSLVLHFLQNKAQGIATTSLRGGSDTNDYESAAGAGGIRIQGTTGEIRVFPHAVRPLQYQVIKKKGGAVQAVSCPIPTDPEREDWGHGMFWEADECARCLRDGKKQSVTMPWDESIAIMEVIQEAMRQGGAEYPELITTDVYDANSPLNLGNQ